MRESPSNASSMLHCLTTAKKLVIMAASDIICGQGGGSTFCLTEWRRRLISLVYQEDHALDYPLQLQHSGQVMLSVQECQDRRIPNVIKPGSAGMLSALLQGR